MVRHVAVGRRVMRDEDADIDTAADHATAGAGGIRNVDDDSLMSDARRLHAAFISGCVADQQSAATFCPSDTGCFDFSTAPSMGSGAVVHPDLIVDFGFRRYVNSFFVCLLNFFPYILPFTFILTYLLPYSFTF